MKELKEHNALIVKMGNHRGMAAWKLPGAGHCEWDEISGGSKRNIFRKNRVEN